MRTLIFSSKQYQEVADLTRPHIQGEYVYNGLPSDDSPSHWGTPVFNNISRITAGYCLDLMNQMADGEVLFYCDSDVLLFVHPQWFADQIGDNDFVFQSDKGTADMGFFIVKVSDKTKTVIKSAIEAMKDDTRNYQEVFNVVTKGMNIKTAFFDTKDVWNYGVIGGMWDGQEFECPKNLKAFHANYTVGIPNKVLLINKFLNEYPLNR
jgi:hypothetical protein